MLEKKLHFLAKNSIVMFISRDCSMSIKHQMMSKFPFHNSGLISTRCGPFFCVCNQQGKNPPQEVPILIQGTESWPLQNKSNSKITAPVMKDTNNKVKNVTTRGEPVKRIKGNNQRFFCSAFLYPYKHLFSSISTLKGGNLLISVQSAENLGVQSPSLVP